MISALDFGQIFGRFSIQEEAKHVFVGKLSRERERDQNSIFPTRLALAFFLEQCNFLLSLFPLEAKGVERKKRWREKGNYSVWNLGMPKWETAERSWSGGTPSFLGLETEFCPRLKVRCPPPLPLLFRKRFERKTLPPMDNKVVMYVGLEIFFFPEISSAVGTS